MMRNIKQGLAFVAGMLYISCWWLLILNARGLLGEIGTWAILPFIGVFFGSLGVAAAIIWFLADNWKAE